MIDRMVPKPNSRLLDSPNLVQSWPELITDRIYIRSTVALARELLPAVEHKMLIAESDGPWWSTTLAAVSGAVVAGIFSLIIWYLNRKRPNIVRVIESQRVSLLRIEPSIRSDLVTTFKGNTVTALTVVELVITNESQEVLKDVMLVVQFNSGTVILETELGGIPATCEPRNADIHVSIPLLNSRKLHREHVKVTVVCDGVATVISASGRGEGWSARLISHDYMIKRRLGCGVMAGILCVLLGSSGMLAALLFPAVSHALDSVGLAGATAGTCGSLTVVGTILYYRTVYRNPPPDIKDRS